MKKAEEKQAVPDIAPLGHAVSTKAAVKVNMYGLDGKFIRSFNSLGEASFEMKINYTSIQKAVSGKLKSAKGYQWRRAE